MKSPSVQYALLAFVITVVWTFIEHAMGYNTTNHAVGQYARMLPSFIFYFFIVWAMVVMKRRLGGKISFADAFRTGIMMCLIYSFLITIWYAVYAEVINKQFQSSLMAFEKSKLVAQNMSPILIDEKMKEVQLTSGGSIGSYVLLFVFTALIGGIVALIASLFIRQKRM